MSLLLRDGREVFLPCFGEEVGCAFLVEELQFATMDNEFRPDCLNLLGD